MQKSAVKPNRDDKNDAVMLIGGRGMVRSVANHSAISDEQIRGNTGKGWTEWLSVLDNWNGEKKSFVAIADHLVKHYNVRRLWAQAIAVYYHWERIKH
jgi:hypothetical protein